MKKFLYTQVDVSYPADWYFEENQFLVDDWIERYMNGYGIEEIESGNWIGGGVHYRIKNIGGTTTDTEAAKAFKEDIENYYQITVNLYPTYDEED